MGIVLGLLGGVAQAIATPPYGIWPLAWVALVPLWLAVLRSQAFTKTAATAIAWGLTYNAITLHWILDLHPLTWMGMTEGNSLVIAWVCWGLVTLWPTSMVLLWVGLLRPVRQRLERRREYRCESGWGLHWRQAPLAFLLLGAGLWCLLDSLWSGSPLYWNPIALSQSPHNRALLHLMQWGGPMLIQGLLVGVNGLIAAGLIGRNRRRLVAALAVLLIAQGLGAGIWLQSLSHSSSVAPPSASEAPTYEASIQAEDSVRIGVVQGNIPTRIKLTEGGVKTALERYVLGYQALQAAGVQAVLMPEGAFPFVWRTEDPRVKRVQRSLGEAIAWIGAFGQDGAHYRQSLFSLEPTQSVLSDEGFSEVLPNSRVQPQELLSPSLSPQTRSRYEKSRYDKVKLVPLGEYIPLARTFGTLIDRLSPLASTMLPGELGQRFETGLGLAGVQICYEPAFSQVIRLQVAQGAEFILSSANLDPYSEVLMAQSEAHDVMRAIENSRWLARASNTGYSGFIDPQGQVLWRSPPHTFVYHAEWMKRRKTLTFYSRWGNWITPLLLGGSLVRLGWNARQSFGRSASPD